MESTNFEQFIREQKNWIKGNKCLFFYLGVSNLHMTSFTRELLITHSMKCTYSLNGFDSQKIYGFLIHQLHVCWAQVDPQGWYDEPHCGQVNAPSQIFVFGLICMPENYGRIENQSLSFFPHFITASHSWLDLNKQGD